ncbi:hypothetical protein [Pediococcus argentinicus]|uniref:Uncharacterized protein n=1 Tax=Pediococcus argentinicus TaxID=480391 RepID=A0A0R2NJY5_9LACO|nr:hypothetical protein [Pediococcus argentinicus]KRO25660.1 hypothetical protein IV88_GL001618 [Pediococcus argentinicus]NKZ22003.1 hypothetical protein [Pediococcus argentinicus]GEP19172.1 hypothetical protein LSA03_05560 [Pediococcus argentinicus]
MSIPLITGILSLITAIITFINTSASYHQTKSETSYDNSQNNFAQINNTNINGQVNIKQTNNKSYEEYRNEKTWQTRSKQSNLFTNISLFLIVIVPIILRDITSIKNNIFDYNHFLLLFIQTVPISILLFSIVNLGSLFLFFKLKIASYINSQDLSIVNNLHKISRIIWPISIFFSFINTWIIYQTKQNIFILLIFIVVNFLGTRTFTEIVFAKTMFNPYRIKNIFIHLSFWILNIGFPFLLFFKFI